MNSFHRHKFILLKSKSYKFCVPRLFQKTGDDKSPSGLKFVTFILSQITQIIIFSFYVIFETITTRADGCENSACYLYFMQKILWEFKPKSAAILPRFSDLTLGLDKWRDSWPCGSHYITGSGSGTGE